MCQPDDFVASNVKITSRISLGVTVWKEKVFTVIHLLLTFFILGWFLYLLTILLIGSDSFKDSDESDHLNNLRDYVMDWK